MNILYFGDNSLGSTSYHRYEALKRLGHNVDIYAPKDILNKAMSNTILNLFHYRTGYAFLQDIVLSWLQQNIFSTTNDYNLIWVNGGEFFGKKVILKLKEMSVPIFLYNNDDPTGGRDGNRFKTLLKAIKFYDLCIVMRELNVPEYYSVGAKRVLRVTMSYDELMHKPYDSQDDIAEKYRSDVAFIGTWMRNEKRDEFLLALAKNGIPISIWGGRWEKSAYWNELKQFHKGGSLSGKDYVAAIQGAKICLGFLSKGNRDLHTQRSLEIPYIGGLFCAERTSEHLELYNDFEEAVFWNDVNECAELCKKLLADNDLRESIRIAGMRKVRSLNVGNEDICRRVIECLMS